ncbi:hypothetical protein AOE58_02595 [Candidatus Riesia pthiripubis]|uniref:Uncharacterized protein n=1 Tax=Candidatus Riesia pthiripubis TaxID=428412 RepID=A0A1V0HPC1_9ENTR|nr:hypothetical protein AOE58_02595 [Candidatus Riesia pthiripubis]
MVGLNLLSEGFGYLIPKKIFYIFIIIQITIRILKNTILFNRIVHYNKKNNKNSSKKNYK